ncbi:F-box protein At2g35280-like [Trifolium pratense]|uniref:F-box protein At2g35280-like n=1 Tax=Trifolium pratense TaxID=57577 RepID=UPI001E693A2B|nr:F-box protein At2g35280-like [Trifolium pratense]
MASLRVKKKINKLHGNNSSISIVEALPNDLLVQIVGRVASRSMADLYKVKLSCKEFLNASEDGYVYQRASMDNFALVPLPWFKREKEILFLRRCRERGNLEIFYREGMVQYFKTLMLNLGLENLKKAALEGHHEAKYVYSMILMANREDEEERKLGFDLFAELKNSVASCRKRVKSFVQSMWVKNRVIVPNQGLDLCHSSSCQRNGTEKKKKKKKYSTWYAAAYKIDDEDDCTLCKYCAGNYELGLFCNMFPV